jgi:hypothetical protein
MMRSVVFAIFLFVFFACKEQGKQDVENLPQAKNDTFDFYYPEYDIPIMEGFLVDTIENFEKATDYTETLICPKIIGKDFIQINQVLRKEIQRKASLCYQIDSTDTAVDTSEEVRGVEYDNILLQMFKNKALVSYGFLSMQTDPKRMRPFRKYFTINYDTERKIFIAFDDYFQISGHDDSALVKSIVYGDIGGPDDHWYDLTNQINFSSDKENVYFYFDMFAEFGNPIGLVKRVKKKYLANFINDAYK